MSRAEKSVSVGVLRQAEALRARRTLGEIDTLRLVRTALDEGASQAGIAQMLQISQATVSRMVAKIAANPRIVAPTVDEVIDRATVGDIDRDEMVRQFRSLRIVYGGKRKSASVGWEELRDARRRQLISPDEAKAAAEVAARRLVGRLITSMELEAQPVPRAAVDAMVRETTEELAADLG